jgi:hypothetical protein
VAIVEIDVAFPASPCKGEFAVPVDPSLYRSAHHHEFCPEHGELMEPMYSLGEVFPGTYGCRVDDKVWTREELATWQPEL